MSLFHMSDHLNHLSDRRYIKGRKDIPKVILNYYKCTLLFSISTMKIKDNLTTYICKRIATFDRNAPEWFIIDTMPGEQAMKSRLWVDPRVEFGMQNRRERRLRK